MLLSSTLVKNIDVLLINMPFGILAKPSIGLGLIKSHLDRIGISSKVLYFSLHFAKLIGSDLYQRICTGNPSTVDQVGEWLFSSALFPDTPASVESYISEVLCGKNPAHRGGNPVEIKNISEEFIQDIRAVGTKVETFMNACISDILAYNPKIVGFSSVFQQHTSSLALAKKIKEMNPAIKILFGGPNCEGIMGAETIKQFPFIDAAVSGEADAIIEELVTKILNSQCVCSIQGVYTRDNVDLLGVNGAYPNGPSITMMDALPFPDYTDYFEQKIALDLDLSVALLFESSRGCWWGAKNHCTFCGLNSLTMGFRSKSADHALTELIRLQEVYPGYRIEVVDNIMDQKYFKSFVPQLAAMGLNIHLFYEIKANLRKDQVRALKEAGILAIQPGIESFSTAILSIMKKGIRGLQNIQLLKWCKEIGVHPIWNFLWGFPGEDPIEYARMARIIPLLSHFVPPQAAQRIHLDRFSPLFENTDYYGLIDVSPFPSSQYIYRELSPESVTNLVYYFTYDYQDERRLEDYVMNCAQSIADWKSTHATSDMHLISLDDELLIWDFRPKVSQHMLTRLSGLERELYLVCDAVQPIEVLRVIMERHVGEAVTSEQAHLLLQPFVERGLMVMDGSSYLSLAVPIGTLSPQYSMLEKMFKILEASEKIPSFLQLYKEEYLNTTP